jgi:outer membrane protein
MNLKLMALVVAFSISLISCNQNINGKTEAGDSTATVETTKQVAVEAVTPNQKASVSNFDGEYKIVYINTDTLWNQYQFVIDGMDKLTRTEAVMRKQYESKAKKFQTEYETYMKQGQAGLLTLKQQQDTEASLKEQQQSLMEMDKSLSERLITKKQTLNKQINDTIVAFIERYRVEKGYTLILQYAYLNGVLAADPALDVTDEVLSRLNAKYEFDKKH